MPYRVLWVVKGLGPGGAERLLVEAARTHDRGSFEIECVFVRADKDHLAEEVEAAGVATHCIGLDRRWPIRLCQLIRRGSYDIVHVHSPALGPVVRMSAWRAQPSIVTTEHNARSTYHPITRMAARSTGRWDSAVICVSEEARRSIRGSAARRATTIIHGIDVEVVRSAVGDRTGVRAELGLSAGEVVVATVANFREQKDYPNLLSAMRLLMDRDVAVRLLAVGQGPLQSEIIALADSLGIGGRVVFAGYRPDAARVLAAADVFTLASRWEGLPVALMEATALGLPVVCTRVGGLAETLVDRRDALLVDAGDPVALADALQQVVEDPSLREMLSAASLRLAPNFDAHRSTGQIEEIYHRAVGRLPDAAPNAQRRPAPPKPTADVVIRPVAEQDRQAIMELGRRCLGWTDDPLFPWLFAWKHDHNPFGRSPGWVAVHEEQIVGVRMLMRWEFERDGQILRALRAVDTATAPESSGRGIFSTLTQHAISEMDDGGIDFVFNTPNSQSRPGYLKLGWHTVGALAVSVRVSGPSTVARTMRSRQPAAIGSDSLSIGRPVAEWLATATPRPTPTTTRHLRTHATPEFLQWRYGAPELRYRAIDVGDGAVIVRARRRGPAGELVVAAHPGLSAAAADRAVSEALAASGCDYAIRLGAPRPRTGFLPVGGGPILTWRSMALHAMPPRPNWNLDLGDIELF